MPHGDGGSWLGFCVILLVAGCAAWRTRRPLPTAPPRIQAKLSVRTVYDGSAPLAGCPWVLFTAETTLGNRVLNLLVDTGSSTLVVASDRCASGCSNVQHVYNTAHGTDTGMSGSVSYGDGSSATGVIIEDVVQLANTSLTMPFLAITSANPIFFSNSGCTPVGDPSMSNFDGILGLAYDSLAVSGTRSWLSAVGSSGQLAADVMSLYFCGDTGELTVGGYNTSRVTHPESIAWAALVSDTYYLVGTNAVYTASGAVSGSLNAIVDSGTTEWVMPSAPFMALVIWFNSMPGWAELFGPDYFQNQECLVYTGSLAQAKASIPPVPPLLIEFASGFALTVDVFGGLVYPLPIAGHPDEIGLCPGIAPWSSVSEMIIGYAVVSQYITFYDMQNNRAGFVGSTSCSFNHTILRSAGTMRATPGTLLLVLTIALSWL